jgi:hypothetical protein
LFRCHRTGRLAQPHQRGPARTTPKPPADLFDIDRSKRAKPRRRRKESAGEIDWDTVLSGILVEP